ncbi:MAG: lamin tail domain-containing protein, partial [Bacteroidota bacterium]|nr:lamin tail domain-containing protein [Bacteroidota bacterium]
MKHIFTILLLSVYSFVFSQFSDNFEFGVLNYWTESNNGRWEASTETPISGTYSLHHTFDNPDSGHDEIAKTIQGLDLSAATTSWRFQIRHGYNPSSGNNWACFLISDTLPAEMHGSGSANGYAVGVNYSGSDDFIKLWRVSSGSGYEVINTSFDWQTNIGTSQYVGLEIQRTAAGEWNILLDADGGFDDLIQIGSSAIDDQYTDAEYFGFHYEYTSSQDMKLWIDDISITGTNDGVAPTITEATAISSQLLHIKFSEVVEQASAEDLANYVIDNEIGQPQSIVYDETNYSEVELSFANGFTSGTTYNLDYSNIKDLHLNSGDGQISFSYELITAESVTITSSNSLEVNFSQEPSVITAENTANYSVNNGLANPNTATVNAADPTKVNLTFSQEFELSQEYTLTVSGVEDQYDNPMEAKDLSFTYYVSQPFDLVINEIMCDINPLPEALPEGEYIELYNRSENPVDLTNWTFTIGDNSPDLFPEIELVAGEFLIICSEESAADFSAYANIIVPILNETDLTVSGKRLVLKDSSENIIDDVSYSDSWYDNTDYDDGGWSLERIDYNNFCGEDDNWTVSSDYTGGTPGRINSVYTVNPDNSLPEVISVTVMSSQELEITFSETPEISTSETATNYTINGSQNPLNASASIEDPNVIELTFDNNFPQGQNSIDISNISDPCENLMENYSGTFTYELIYPVSVQVMSDNQLRVYFSEAPELQSAENTANYTLNQDIGQPSIAQISNSNAAVVDLIFDQSFTGEETYTLTISNINDINSNIMQPTDLDFIYYLAKAFDVVFTEIMSDVNPEPAGLPAVEYVEIYNTSDFTLDLTAWTFLAEGQTETELPYITLSPGEYLVLAEDDMELESATVLNILSESDLNSSGKNIRLSDSEGNLIHELNYTDEWYGESGKDGGGWSLEVIDPENVCELFQNWTACSDPAGGTPGRINSSDAENPDSTPPSILEVQIVSSTDLDIYFSEIISESSGLDPANYSVPEIGNPGSIDISENKTIVRVHFDNEFQDKQDYELFVENILDNCGNLNPGESVELTYHRINITTVKAESGNHLLVNYSEMPDRISAVDTSNYFIDNTVGSPYFVYTENNDSSKIHLLFESGFPEDEALRFSVSNIYDRNNNLMPTFDTTFIFHNPQQNDLLINEVLFNPFTGGTDFVELYNNSEYIIDLKNIYLAKRADDGSLEQKEKLSTASLYFSPGEFMAFTENKELVLRDYMSENEQHIIETNDFPSYTDESSTVVVLNAKDSVIDQFEYHEDMHYELLADEDGVSLERIKLNAPTQDNANWHSASEDVGFATPAYENSQALEETGEENAEVYLEPLIFSPDHDGFED